MNRTAVIPLCNTLKGISIHININAEIKEITFQLNKLYTSNEILNHKKTCLTQEVLIILNIKIKLLFFLLHYPPCKSETLKNKLMRQKISVSALRTRNNITCSIHLTLKHTIIITYLIYHSSYIIMLHLTSHLSNKNDIKT